MTAQLDERLLVAGAVFLAPLLFDTSWTLLRRLWRGENLLQAHRTHLYQRMAAAGYSHRIVTLIYGTAAIVSSAGAILWLLGARRGETIMGAAVVLPCCAIWGLTLWIESRVRSLATESSQAHQSLRSEVSGERLFSLWSFFSGVGQRLGVVWIALISALIIRFLWMTSVEGAVTPQTYWTYVNASLEAFTGSLMPTTILGLAVFGGFEIFSRSRKQKSRKLFFTLLPYSIFFPAILLYRLLPIENSHFPRLTWVVAWAISVVIVATGLLIENLQERNKKEESHSVASEIIIDGILIALAFSGAYLVRFETLPLPDPFQQQLFLLLPYVVLSGIVFNCSWGVYSLLRRFTGIRDSLVIAQSVASLAFLFLLLRIALFQSHELLRIPFGVVVSFPILMYGGLIGARLLRCWQYRKKEPGLHLNSGKTGPLSRILLAGAGITASRLAQLKQEDDVYVDDVHVIGAVDDQARTTGKRLEGVKVSGKTQPGETNLRDSS